MKLASGILAGFVLSLAPLAAAAETWVPLNANSPAGTPAQVTLDADSNYNTTRLTLQIFGFWQEDLVGPDGTSYQRIRVPGLGHVGQIGAPDLPALRGAIAVISGAPEMKFQTMTTLAQSTFSNMTIYPLGIAGMDEEVDPTGDPGEGDTQGTNEVFQHDDAIYGSSAAWPPVAATPSKPVIPQVAGVKGADCECFPIRWNPATKKMTVATIAKYEFGHGSPGPAGPPQLALNKGAFKLVKNYFFNHAAIGSFVIENLNKFQSRFLIVTPSKYMSPPATYDASLKPFVKLKQSQGYEVQIAQLAGGENWLQILAKIVSWYNATITGYEHYCLLVGDTDAIPLAFDIGTSSYTDDIYGSPLDLDLNEEVCVGRLSVDGVLDLSNQVQKIVNYEVNPMPTSDYRRALLVAHKQGAPDKYQGAHESVANAVYSDPPIFIKRYGSIESSNIGVVTDLNHGIGLLCYRGHGSTNTWSGWNLASGDFNKNDVLFLTNELRPVVWSISCTNHNLASGGGGMTDCLGEAWLEVGWGAVASYGATAGTGTIANHELDRRLFKGVFDLGLTTHAHAIAYAEAKMTQAYPDSPNAWRYNLLGDPSMKIRYKFPQDIKTFAPASYSFAGGLQTISIQAKTAAGAAMKGALVALSKPGASPSAPTEIFVNGYTNTDGVASFQVQPKSLGDIQFTVQDDLGNVADGAIPVIAANGCEGGKNEHYGVGKAGSTGIPTLSALTVPTIGKVNTLEIAGALPGALPFLMMGFAPLAMPFDGGTLLLTPSLIFALPPIKGDGTLALGGTLPSNVSLCGFEQYFQAMYVDPAAPGFYHLALTNAVHQTIGG